jgi:hypothetical protein
LGVDNDVFYMDQTMMLLSDAKKMVEDINKALQTDQAMRLTGRSDAVPSGRHPVQSATGM